MDRRRTALALAVILAGCLAPLARGAGYTLENETALFPAATVLAPNQRPAWAARLSPDGKHVLYARPAPAAPGPFAGRPAELPRELVLRELAMGNERVLPVPATDFGMAAAHARFNFFDPAGGRLVLHRMQNGPDGRTEMAADLYDVADGKVTPTGLRGSGALAKFDRAGKALIVNVGNAVAVAPLPDFKPRPLAAPNGFVQSVSPAADVVAIYARRGVARGRRPAQGPRRPVGRGRRQAAGRAADARAELGAGRRRDAVDGGRAVPVLRRLRDRPRRPGRPQAHPRRPRVGHQGAQAGRRRRPRPPRRPRAGRGDDGAVP